jgi:tRNA(Met) cytidine acetyltransferase
MCTSLTQKSKLARVLVVVRDSASARHRAAQWLSQARSHGEVAWFGPVVPETLPGTRPAQAPHWLGRELAAAVFVAGAEPAADALAIVAGLVRGGGVLLILVSTRAISPFGQRWQHFLREPHARWRAETDVWPLPHRIRNPTRLQLNPGQRAIFRRAADLPAFRDGSCVLLTAARGRGKSTLLGAWVRHWLANGNATVSVTAPNPAAIQALMHQLEPVGEQETIGSSLYRAPEQVLASAPPQVLVVDEAAAFPVHQLLALAAHVPRTVFATTTTGFEGSGKGFHLRFLKGLQARGVTPREYRLHRPLRWMPNDPVEDWVNRLFLLEAEAGGAPGRTADLERIGARVQWRSGAYLARHESDLRDLVGLLSDAHYRTRPSDLLRWLDDPDLAIGLLRGPGRALLGVVLTLAEPGLSASEARSVWAGERRPPGRFLPCVLAAHGAFSMAAVPALRVTRIAVHPDWQRQGLGHRLLRAVEARARRQGYALVGASFGVTPELLHFWQQGGFDPVRIGFRRESTSGLHAAVVCRGLNRSVRADLDGLRRQVAADWPIWREAALSALEPVTAETLSRCFPEATSGLRIGDADSVRAFAYAQRPFELALPALRRWLDTDPACLEHLSPPERQLLEASVLQVLDWPGLCGLSGESGRNGVVRRLRHIVARSLTGPA